MVNERITGVPPPAARGVRFRFVTFSERADRAAAIVALAPAVLTSVGRVSGEEGYLPAFLKACSNRIGY
jgi:hypothetical protein